MRIFQDDVDDHGDGDDHGDDEGAVISQLQICF